MIDGDLATEFEWTYMAFVKKSTEENGIKVWRHICTGFRISKRIVFTTAKCVLKTLEQDDPHIKQYSEIFIRSFSFLDRDHAIENVHCHKDYNPDDRNTSGFNVGFILVDLNLLLVFKIALFILSYFI